MSVDLALTASRLLAQYGEAITFTYYTGGVLDPDTGRPSTEVENTISGYGYPANYHGFEINGTAIKDGDIKLICEKVRSRPQIGWFVTVDSKRYRVMNVKKVRRSAEDIVYICQIRS